jgi:hypothetical protein
VTWPQEAYDLVHRLIAEDRNDCEISRLTQIPRGTVRDWRHGRSRQSRRGTGGYGCTRAHDFLALPAAPYAYLLGMYLGDGYIARYPRGVWQLRIVTDARYPGIIEECREAMEALMPGQRAYRFLRKDGCVEISMYSKHWVCLFPQHGPGRKHDRLIRLEAWQDELVQQATPSLIRGLIHSDGCRTIANDRGVPSLRYHFTNRSEDIKSILCAALDRLGIRWTRSSEKQLSIYRKESTSRLDTFVGPKR